jgi:hypothetical protein
MHPQPYFVKFAVNDRQHRVLQDMERSRSIETTGKQAKGQWWQLLARWAPAARAEQSVVRTEAGSRSSQPRYVSSSKPQEQCC